MKLARLTDARFHNVFRKLSAQPLPLRVAYKLKGIAAKVDLELKKFEECRTAALEKYGKRDEQNHLITKEGGAVEFEAEQLKAFAAELNDLGQMEVDVGTVPVSELGDKVEITVDELTLLDGVLVE